MRKCLLLFIVFCTYCFSNAFTQTITFSHVSPTCPGTSNLGQVTASSLTSLGTGTYNVTWNGIVVSTISLVNGSGVSPAFNTSNFESGTFPFVISTFSSSINFIVQSTSTPTITCSTNINVNNSTGQCQAYVTVPSPTICSVLQLGNGLNFDGIDDVVSVPSTSVINQQNFQRRTVEVSFRVNNSASSTKQVIWEEGGSNNGINIYIEAGRLYYGIWSNTQSWTGVWLSTTLINNNQWHSAALVYDGTISNGTLKAFLDGVLVESANKSLGVLGDTLSLHTGANAIGAILNQTRFHDGANNGTNTNYFGGDIDELRLWTIARTATEIKSSRNIQLSGSETGLIIYYDFNQGTACGNNTSITTLPNRTATTGLNGTLTNFALTSCTSNWSTGFRILNYLASLTNSFNNTSNASDNYPIGNTIVTWTATDSSGNITTCNQTITVVDNQSPVLTSCPANVTLCGSQVVNYSLPTATDNCSVIVTQTAGLPSGSTFPVGTTTNTFTLADPSGNSVSCSFTVTINTAPTITTQPSTPAATCSGTGTQTMSVVATGTNLTYQWRRNSVNLINGGVISGATTPTLTLTNPTSADEGSYDVVVSGTCTPTATSNAVTVTTSPSALNFDGSNDSLVVPYFSKLNTNLLTVECWVKPTSGNQSGSIIATWPINAGPNSSFNGFGFRQRNDAQGGPGTEHFRFALGNDGTGNVVNSTIKPVADTWFHLAATYDGSVIKLYVNGIFQNQTTSTRIINSPENLSIGKLTSGTQLFNGTIDEIRIWDRVLCVSEIQNNMNCELPSGQVGLIAYYKLNSGCVGVNNSGLTTAFDASGNNNNGTLYNFALNGATSNWVAGNTTGSCSNFSIPDVPSTVTASSTNICSGQTLNLSAISTNNTINWFTTPYAGSSVGSSASGANFAVTPNTNTTYYAEAINASSCTSASRTPITIKVNQLSVLDQPSNQILCNGISSTPVLFSSSNINTVYNWTNNNNAIGLASNGVGDINSFNAVNSSSIPIVSTVSTTPSTGNGSNAYAYIANYDNSTVQVINTSTSSIVSTINVGLNPVALIINNENSKVYVANRGSNTVSVINTSTNTVLSTINVGTQPYGLAISNDDTRLYVINRTSETVSAINLQTNQILNTIVLGVGSSPSSAILNNDGSKLYLVNNGSTYNSVSVINTVSNTITNTIPVGTRPYQITISQDGTKLFVSNNTGSSVSVINTSTETVVSTITVGSGPRGLVLNQDATKLYVVNRNSNSVSIINTSNNVVTNTIDIGLNTNPYGISLTHDGNYLFVTNQTSNNVSKINTKTLLSEATIGVSAIPYSNGRFITAGSPFCSGVSKQFSITVNPTPQGSISGNTICNGGTGQLTFTATSGTGPFTLIINGETYSSISSGVSFNVTNNPTTTTNYTLTSITDANNCVRTSDFTNANASITVNPTPQGSISGNTICNGGTGQLTFTSSFGTGPFTLIINGVSYSSITSGVAFNVTNNPTTTTNYTLTSITDANNCVRTNNFTNANASITVNAVPTALINTNGPTTFCEGGSVTLTANQSPANGNSLVLNGTNRIEGGHNSPLNILGSLTIEAWINHSSRTVGQWYHTQEIAGKNQDTHNGFYGLLYDGSSGNYYFLIKFDQGHSSAAFPISNIPLNTWKHITGVYNSSTKTVAIYLDGILKSSTNVNAAWTRTSTTTTSPFTIGNMPTYNGYPFMGKIDEVRVWNIARSASEIAENYNRIVNPQSTGIVGYYKLDNNSNNQYVDASLNAIHLTAVNNPSLEIPSTAPLYSSILWNNNSISQSLLVTNNTNHNFTATNSFGCSAISQTEIITVNPTPQGSISGNTICNGGTGQLTFTSSFGTGPFTLIINGVSYSSITSGVAFNVTNNPTTTTNYTLTSITDANSCVRTSDFTNANATITVNPLTAITVQPSAVVYCKDATATPLSVTATGTGTITYQWFSNSTNSTTGASSVGNTQTYTPATTTVGTTYYFAVVHSDCGPDITSNIVAVTINTIPQGSISGNTICNGGTGQLTFTATSGTGPFTLIINGETYSSITSGVAFNVTNNPTTTTNYTLTSVTDANSCVRTSDFTNASATITVNPLTAISVQPTGATYCKDATATALSVTATGTGTITYQWFSNSTNSTSGASSVGNAQTYTPATTTVGTTYYFAVVHSDCGPDITSNIVAVTINAIPQGSISGNTICNGGTGQLTFTSTSGTGPFTLIINGETYSSISSGVAFNVTNNPTTTTNYTLTSVTDANNCVRTSDFTNANASITVNTAPSITTQPITPAATCSGSGTQNLSVVATGTNLTYQWRRNNVNLIDGSVISGATTSTLTLTNPTTADAGNYDVVVSGTCSPSEISNAITVTVHAIPQGSLSGNTICSGGTGQLTFLASSGADPQTLVINGYTYSPITNGVPFNAFPNPTNTNTYTLTSITDINGCIRTSGITNPTTSITINPLPTVSPITSLSTIEVLAVGGGGGSGGNDGPNGAGGGAGAAVYGKYNITGTSIAVAVGGGGGAGSGCFSSAPGGSGGTNGGGNGGNAGY
ncbi:MAG: HYR domain-containing protein, partial [Chitinophagaceae bacterium]|nr:HYR domain-containing protein [Chitinophagaceae bacterium]